MQVEDMVGTLLIEMTDRLGHGNFLPWIKTEWHERPDRSEYDAGG